jgi:hypothetical protein
MPEKVSHRITATQVAIADDNPSYRDTHIKELILFILGAATRAAFGVLPVLLSKIGLEGKLPIVYESLVIEAKM